jgi:hypothetical protein
MKAIRIKQLMGASLGLLVCVILTQTGSARVVQGFEPGDLAVAPTGDASVVGTFEGEAAPQGSNQYLLTSLTGTADNDGFTDVSGTAAVTNASLQSFFFNDISGTLTGLRGSGVLIPFTVMPGETTLTFQYDFLSNQPFQSLPRNDFAFEAIFNSSNTLVQGASKFAMESNGGFSLFGASPFIEHTGYQTFSINISGLTVGQTYNLGIGVEALSGGSAQHDSGVLIDNVQVVPEPTTIAFSIAGASLLVALRSRFKKSS